MTSPDAAAQSWTMECWQWVTAVKMARTSGSLRTGALYNPLQYNTNTNIFIVAFTP